MAGIKERMDLLEGFALLDEQPVIEADSPAVSFYTGEDRVYADSEAFDTSWKEETKYSKKLDEILTNGKKYVSMIYTYRSCSKALPQVKASDDPKKDDIYQMTFNVLSPEIDKLKAFMKFQRATIDVVVEYIKLLCQSKTVFSETFIVTFARVLDQLSLLDELKNMKACLNNDFSFYKRAFSYLKKGMSGDDSSTTENHELHNFLANQSSITAELKKKVQAIPGFDAAVILVINTCARLVEELKFLIPDDKFLLLRVLPYGLSLMDGGEKNQFNVFKNKNVNLRRFSQIFKMYPVVPLYGDMQITLEAIMRTSPNFDEKIWGKMEDLSKHSEEYQLVYFREGLRTAHAEYTSSFMLMLNKIKTEPATPKLANEVLRCTINGLNFLGRTTSKILQQAAWKYAKPNPNPALDDYARVVKDNYTLDDSNCLVEVIAYVKGVGRLIQSNAGTLLPLLETAIHDDLQRFIQGDVTEMLRYASKKKSVLSRKKDTGELRGEIIQLRELAADWKGGIEPQDAMFGTKKKPAKKDAVELDLVSRSVAPSSTQLELIRNIVYGFISHTLLDDKKKGKYSSSDFESKAIDSLTRFYSRSFYFPYLMNLSQVIDEITDIGDLWYREFYLELQKKLQFPIDMSLPWILTDRILENKTHEMMEYVLYPLSIYNDAANRALGKLNQRFLYEEIEAEVNLAFDQLLFKVTEQTYSFYKVKAASNLMEKNYHSIMIKEYPDYRLTPPKSRYETLFKQRHYMLMGRSIDLNTLIGQRINAKIKQNINFAIRHFEANSIAFIKSLEDQLDVLKLTYDMLSKIFELDSWESILREVNQSSSLVSFQGRIALHALFELVYDFLPNWSFNSLTQRFIQSPVTFVDPVDRSKDVKLREYPMLFGNKGLTIAYSKIEEMYSAFFGKDHYIALIRVLGVNGLPIVLEELLNNLELKFVNALQPYVEAVMAGIPPKITLPRIDYSPEGSYGYFELQLQDLKEYSELDPQVRQHFTELGNTIVFFSELDSALTLFNQTQFVLAAPFLGVTLENVIKSDAADPSEQSPIYRVIATALSHLSVPDGEAITKGTWQVDKLYRPPSVPVSIFSACLQRIASMLGPVWDQWSGDSPENGVINVEKTTEFYRLWCAMQFLQCLPLEKDVRPAEEMFGDGLTWGGIAIIYFMGQQHRFGALNWVYHVLKTMDTTPKSEWVQLKETKVKGVDPKIVVGQKIAVLESFYKKGTDIKTMNEAIFAALEAYAPLPPQEIKLFKPPEKADWEKAFISAAKAEALTPTAKPSTFAPPPIKDEPEEPEDSSGPSIEYEEEPGGPPPPPPPEDGPPAPPVGKRASVALDGPPAPPVGKRASVALDGPPPATRPPSSTLRADPDLPPPPPKTTGLPPLPTGNRTIRGNTAGPTGAPPAVPSPRGPTGAPPPVPPTGRAPTIRGNTGGPTAPPPAVPPSPRGPTGAPPPVPATGGRAPTLRGAPPPVPPAVSSTAGRRAPPMPRTGNLPPPPATRPPSSTLRADPDLPPPPPPDEEDLPPPPPEDDPDLPPPPPEDY